MSKSPWIALFPSDYLADTAHLGLTEHGIYWRLLLHYYQHESPLPGDLEKICRIIMASTPEERRTVEYILTEYFIMTPLHDGGRVWRHARADMEIESSRERRELAIRRGLAGGKATRDKWQGLKQGLKPSPSMASSMASSTPSTSTSTSTSRITITEKEEEWEDKRNPKSCSGQKSPTATHTDQGTGLTVIAGTKSSKQKPQAKTGAIWAAYSTAYFNRYGTEPVRNAKINGQLAQIIDRLGADEAPHVAACYVGSNNSFYVTRRHSVDCLLRDCEGLRTEWATGTRMSATEARNLDKNQNTAESFRWLKDNLTNMLNGSEK